MIRPSRSPWILVLFVPAVVGCAAVPDLTFGDDASIADAPSDGVSDATQAEGGDAGGCTGAAPAGTAICCGATWCEGSCSQADCTNCVASCAGSNKPICCKTTNNLTCKNAAQPCN